MNAVNKLEKRQHAEKNYANTPKKIDTDKMKKPAFLMILSGVGDYAYRRQDGIYVVPVGCLKN